jgi:hypothetical protein
MPPVSGRASAQRPQEKQAGSAFYSAAERFDERCNLIRKKMADRVDTSAGQKKQCALGYCQ